MIATKPRTGLGQVVLDAELEARRRGDRRVGTEHVLLALLVDPDAVPSRALGVSLAEVHDALRTLDWDALATLGIVGPALDAGAPLPKGGRIRLTPGAVDVIRGLGKLPRRGRLGLEHVLLALMARTPPDPAAAVLDALAVDRDHARRVLAES
jgi:hypothetical protein